MHLFNSISRMSRARNKPHSYPAVKRCWPRTSPLSGHEDVYFLDAPLVKSIAPSPTSPRSPPCPAAPRGWAGSLTTARGTEPRIAADHLYRQEPPRSEGDCHLHQQERIKVHLESSLHPTRCPQCFCESESIWTPTRIESNFIYIFLLCILSVHWRLWWFGSG